jgi:Ca-activated chloride channel family protein
VSFIAPTHLWLLVGVIGAAVAIARLDNARRRALGRFAAPESAPTVASRRPGWRRSVIAVGLVATFVALVLASARPALPIDVRVNTATIMVALDTSTSMGSHDVQPSRVEAAQRAAATFLRALPRDFRVGLIQFAGAAAVEAAPGDDRQLALEATKNVKLSDGTAIGEAIFSALDTMAEDAGKLPTGTTSAPKYPKLPAAAIVLLSDGDSNTGRPDSLAITAAHGADVPVSTIAFGTKDGTIGRDRQPVPVREEALQAIAAGTGGQFFRAASGPELRSVFESLQSRLSFEQRPKEVTRWFTGVAIVLALLTGAFSLWHFSRMP